MDHQQKSQLAIALIATGLWFYFLGQSELAEIEHKPQTTLSELTREIYDFFVFSYK